MSSTFESDRLRDIADDLRAVCEMTDQLASEGDVEVGFVGNFVCIVGLGIGVVTCVVAGLLGVVAFGLGISFIRTDLGLGMSLISLELACLACLACLIWVIRRARSRSRPRVIDNSLVDGLSHPIDGWSHPALAWPLRIAVRLFLPADVRWIKWEEWCTELACIDSRWEKTVYLLDLLGKMYRVARAADEGLYGPPSCRDVHVDRSNRQRLVQRLVRGGIVFGLLVTAGAIVVGAYQQSLPDANQAHMSYSRSIVISFHGTAVVDERYGGGRPHYRIRGDVCGPPPSYGGCFP